MLRLKGLECLLLLLLAVPARHVSAVLSCSSSGSLYDDTSTCQKEDLNAAFGAKVDSCDSYGNVSGGIKIAHRVPPPFPLAGSPSPATDTVIIKWWGFGALCSFATIAGMTVRHQQLGSTIILITMVRTSDVMIIMVFIS